MKPDPARRAQSIDRFIISSLLLLNIALVAFIYKCWNERQMHYDLAGIRVELHELNQTQRVAAGIESYWHEEPAAAAVAVDTR